MSAQLFAKFETQLLDLSFDLNKLARLAFGRPSLHEHVMGASGVTTVIVL